LAIHSLDVHKMTYIYVLDFDDIDCYFRLECRDTLHAIDKVCELRNILSTRDSRSAIVTSPNDLSRDRISEIFLEWQLSIVNEILIEIRDRAFKDEVHISKLLRKERRRK
jgi:hypothetical protein